MTTDAFPASAAEEPVLDYAAMHPGQTYAPVSWQLDDTFVDAYLQATGEHHPLFTHAGGYAPPLCTSLVRFVKASLGGRWPTGTVHLSQDMRWWRPLRRGDRVSVQVQIGDKYHRNGRDYIELLATTYDGTQQPLLESTMRMLWAGATQPVSPGRTPRPAPEIPDGEPLTPITTTMTSALLHAYGDVAAARDAIHLDPQYARQTRFGANIAQGLLVLTLLSRLLTANVGAPWLHAGTLQVRFVRPAFVDEPITARGVLLAGSRHEYAVWCDNQHSQRIITGMASIQLS